MSGWLSRLAGPPVSTTGRCLGASQVEAKPARLPEPGAAACLQMEMTGSETTVPLAAQNTGSRRRTGADHAAGRGPVPNP